MAAARAGPRTRSFARPAPAPSLLQGYIIALLVPSLIAWVQLHRWH